MNIMEEFYLSIDNKSKVAQEIQKLRLNGFSMLHVSELQYIALYYSIHTTVSTADAWHAFYEVALNLTHIHIPPYEILTGIKNYARGRKK